MSRAINVKATQTEVTAMCARHKIQISAIEPLLDGGTRVVLMNTDDTAIIARAFKSNIISGVSRRVPLYSRQR
jgi:diketogulonate reductase-like aldo/keto reductase